MRERDRVRESGDTSDCVRETTRERDKRSPTRGRETNHEEENVPRESGERACTCVREIEKESS